MEVIHTVNITAQALYDYDCLFDTRRQPTWEQAVEASGGDIKKAFAAYDKYDVKSGRLDEITLKRELSVYIGYQVKAGRVPWWGYFRADYDDDGTGERLKLFIEKGKPFGIMQVWNVVGICRSEDWNEDDEDDGRSRAWCKSDYYENEEDVPKDYRDWAVSDRVRQVIQNTEKTLYENVLREVQNEFNNARDKRDAEAMAFLQSVCFDIRGRRKPKKDA